MLAKTVADGKNGPGCNIAFDSATHTITVKSNLSPAMGYIVLVTEGTVANLPGTPPQGANKQCAVGRGGSSVSFKVCGRAGFEHDDLSCTIIEAK